MELRELVTGRPHLCGPDTTVGEAAAEMARRGLGSLAVVDGRKFVGVVTERDLVRAMAARADLEASPVSEWMGADPDTFGPEVDVWDAAEWLLEAGYRHLPVVEDAELLGVVSLRDLLRAVVASAE
jgi:CBS domain-containing protein